LSRTKADCCGIGEEEDEGGKEEEDEGEEVEL
jgi:hypothetical protein